MAPNLSPRKHAGAALALPRLCGPGARQAGHVRAAPARGLSFEQLSSLLRAGFALQCHGSGGRAALPRRGAGEVELYVCLQGGCYRYAAPEHALVLVSPHDARGWTTCCRPGVQPELALVYVTSEADDADTWEEAGCIPAANVAAIAGNVAAWAAAAGLTARGQDWVHPGLARLLQLHPGQHIALAQTLSAPAAAVH